VPAALSAGRLSESTVREWFAVCCCDFNVIGIGIALRPKPLVNSADAFAAQPNQLGSTVLEPPAVGLECRGTLVVMVADENTRSQFRNGLDRRFHWTN
jgi:hypothetical protein